MSHRKRLRKTVKKLDQLKKREGVKAYKRKERALNNALRRLKL